MYVEMQASVGYSRAVGRIYLSDLYTLPHGETMKARNHDELILEFEQTLLRFEANGIRYSKEDPEYRKTYKADLRDLRKGLNLMKKGKYIQAYEWISGLDTNVREIPPEAVWEKLVASRGWQE